MSADLKSPFVTGLAKLIPQLVLVLKLRPLLLAKVLLREERDGLRNALGQLREQIDATLADLGTPGGSGQPESGQSQLDAARLALRCVWYFENDWGCEGPFPDWWPRENGKQLSCGAIVKRAIATLEERPAVVPYPGGPVALEIPVPEIFK